MQTWKEVQNPSLELKHTWQRTLGLEETVGCFSESYLLFVTILITNNKNNTSHVCQNSYLSICEFPLHSLLFLSVPGLKH